MYCGNYETPRFKDVYESYTTFNTAMATSGIPLKITEESLQTLYYLLYARYALSHIATSDTSQFAYKVASTIFMYGPTWEKRLEIQDTIRSWTEEDLLNGALQINNLSTNPAQEPATTSFEILPYTNQQTATKYKKSKLDGYSYLMSLLEKDVSEEFIGQFAKYFMTFVGWPHSEEEEEDLGTQTKTITPTKSTQYVQADEGYILDTVVVNPIPSQYIIPAGTLNITQNNEYNVANYQRVNVNVQPKVQTLSVATNGIYTPPAGIDGFNSVSVNVAGGGGTIDYSILRTNASYGGNLYNITLTGKKLVDFTTRNDQEVVYNYYDTISNDICYLATNNSPILLNGSTGNKVYEDIPCSYVIITSNLQLYYSECSYQPPTPGPSGDWAIGTDFTGKTISYNSQFYGNGHSLYGTFYPDATEPASITINFENGYKLVISEPNYDGSTSSIVLRDPTDQPLQTIADINTGTYNSFTFNSSTYTISSVTYDGIYWGSEFDETTFWTKVTETLDDMINVT